MGEKVTINGKEYTERSINFIEINGNKVTNGIITTEIGKNGPKVSAIIQVDGSSFEAASNDFVVQGQSDKVINNNIEDKERVDNFYEKKEVIQGKESENWIVKLIKRIKNIFISRSK